MRKIFVPLTVLTAALFAYAPVAIAGAPNEATMGLVWKIFYFHVPSWEAMYAGIAVCGIASAVHLFRTRPAADRVAVSAAELTVLFGLIGLITGPLWARRAWGVWWVWDPRLTMAFLMELVFVAYLLVRAYGGPGSDKLAAAVGVFGAAVSPFVYFSVNIWRTLHPLNTVVPTLPASMRPPFYLTSVAFLCLFALLFTARLHLARQQAALDNLYLADEDSAV